MRRNVGGLMGALVLAALWPTVSVAHCGHCEMDDAKAAAPGKMMEDHAARFKEKLGLTDEQAAQVKTIMEEKHQKMMQLQEESKSKIEALLTAEQKAKFSEIKACTGMPGCKCPMCADKDKAHKHPKTKKN